MITKQDCVDPICFFCKEKIENKDICYFITKGRINYQNFDDPKYMIINGYWKEKCSTPVVFSTIAFHEQCFSEVAEEEYQFDKGAPEDPLIIL